MRLGGTLVCPRTSCLRLPRVQAASLTDASSMPATVGCQKTRPWSVYDQVRLRNCGRTAEPVT